MNIKYTPVDISARVKDVDDQKDVMKDITVMVDCLDQDSGVSVFYQLYHRFPEENVYTDETPFVEFDDISEENVMSFVQSMIDSNNQMHEWVQTRIQEIIDEPVKKAFTFQRVYPNTVETIVGIGSSSESDTESNSEI